MLPILVTYNCSQWSLMTFLYFCILCMYFCVVCCDFSIFVSYFIILILLHTNFFFFSLIALANALSFIYLLKEPDLHFIDFFAIANFVSFSLISALIFMIFFFILLTLGFFFSSFCVCFRYKCSWFLWCSSSSLRQSCMPLQPWV